MTAGLVVRDWRVGSEIGKGTQIYSARADSEKTRFRSVCIDGYLRGCTVCRVSSKSVANQR
jgi:hypothetical protein